MIDLAFHEYFMRLALEEADRAGDNGEVPTGCVIIEMPEDEKNPNPSDVRILARASNRTESEKNPTAHAEMLAISLAAATIGDFRLTRAALYVTKEPCAMCAGAIVLARIPVVVYGVGDPKRGGQSVFGILTHPALIHRADVTEGILAAECKCRLQEFFRVRR